MVWLLGIGIFFFIMSFPIMFDDFGTGIFGLFLGLVLIAVGLLMLKKKRPEFFRFLSERNFRSALRTLSKDYAATQSAYADLDRQIIQREAEHSLVNDLPDQTPASLNGVARKYHYKDVCVWVRWEYGGHYGKSCESIGMKRGDALKLLPPKEKDQDPGSVAIYWNGTEIGYMKTNRMRDMVHSWQAANLPVLAVVSYVGGEDKLLVEFAFYGCPN